MSPDGNTKNEIDFVIVDKKEIMQDVTVGFQREMTIK